MVICIEKLQALNLWFMVCGMYISVWVKIYAGIEVIYENNQQDLKITTFEYHITIRELYEEMQNY